MIPTNYGILQQKASVGLIETDKSSITCAYTSGAYSDYCTINTTPDSVTTTITPVDTGDGTLWAIITPNTGTGDYSFRARTTSENTGPTRHMIARITDNAGIAPSVDVTINQGENPV